MVKLQKINGSIIITEARKYLGVKWRHKGRQPMSLDCVGLLIRVYTDLNLINCDFMNYGRNPETYVLKQELLKLKFKQVYSNYQDGDLFLVKTARFPCHIGFLSMKNNQLHMLHSNSDIGFVIEEPYTSKWDRYKEGFFRAPFVLGY